MGVAISDTADAAAGSSKSTEREMPFCVTLTSIGSP